MQYSKFCRQLQKNWYAPGTLCNVTKETGKIYDAVRDHLRDLQIKNPLLRLMLWLSRMD